MPLFLWLPIIYLSALWSLWTEAYDSAESRAVTENVNVAQSALSRAGKNPRMFQIVLSELDRDGNITVHRPVQPLYELREDAVAIAEFDALRLSVQGNYETSDDCIQFIDGAGKTVRIEVREVVAVD